MSPETVTSPLASLADIWAFNDKLLATVGKDLTAEEWRHRAGEGNHAQWLLGHVAASRRWALRLLGEEVADEPWERHFGRGAGPGPGDDVDPAQLADAFRDAGRRLVTLLRGVTGEQAGAPLGQEFPDGSSSVAGGMHFLYMHETYHLGQIGLLRRAVGREGIA